MELVVTLCAELTHTHLFSLAEELPKSGVYLTHPVFQTVYRLNQPMFLQTQTQSSDSLMWLQVGLSERCETRQDFTAFSWVLVQTSQRTSPGSHTSLLF